MKKQGHKERMPGKRSTPSVTANCSYVGAMWALMKVVQMQHERDHFERPRKKSKTTETISEGDSDSARHSCLESFSEDSSTSSHHSSRGASVQSSPTGQRTVSVAAERPRKKSKTAETVSKEESDNEFVGGKHNKATTHKNKRTYTHHSSLQSKATKSKVFDVAPIESDKVERIVAPLEQDY